METITDDKASVQETPQGPCPLRALPEPFAQELRVELAMLQARHPMLADALGRANAVLVEGRLFPGPDGESALVRSADYTGIYSVVSPRESPHSGSCDCPSSVARPQETCKHRHALRLWQFVQKRLAMPKSQMPVIRPEWLDDIQGKKFIKFEGLLTLAHERGLVSLETTVVVATPDFAVCQATAVFRDGTRFTDIGDATKENVKKHVAPHFIRMAATRSSARALRRALNIDMAAAEELAE